MKTHKKSEDLPDIELFDSENEGFGTDKLNSMAASTKHLFFLESVEESAINRFIAILLGLKIKPKDKYIVHLTSPGGCLVDYMRLKIFLDAFSKNLIFQGEGQIGSVAAFWLTSFKGRRLMQDGAILQFHDVRMLLSEYNTPKALLQAQYSLKYSRNFLIEQISKRSGVSVKELVKLCTEDVTEMTAQEALKLNLIDEIIT